MARVAARLAGRPVHPADERARAVQSQAVVERRGPAGPEAVAAAAVGPTATGRRVPGRPAAEGTRLAVAPRPLEQGPAVHAPGPLEQGPAAPAAQVREHEVVSVAALDGVNRIVPPVRVTTAAGAGETSDRLAPNVTTSGARAGRPVPAREIVTPASPAPRGDVAPALPIEAGRPAPPTGAAPGAATEPAARGTATETETRAARARRAVAGMTAEVATTEHAAPTG